MERIMVKSGLLGLTVAMLALTATVSSANGRDPETGSRAQERLDRETARTAERSEERAARYAEERARIEERALQEPDKAATDLAKLDADQVREQEKIAEDAAKAQEDFAEESAKEAEDAAEESDKLAERGDDGGSSGSSQMMRDLGDSEGAEHDQDGYPVRRGEVVGMDFSAATLDAARTRGFRVIERTRLGVLDREVVRLAAPAGMTSLAARKVMQDLDPKAVVDLVHYYGLNLTAGGKGKRIGGNPPLRRGTGPLSVGVIDTAVISHPALGGARIVSWQDGLQPGAPSAHGTAVASLIAGEGQATIYSANIFRGSAARPFTSADVIAEALEWNLAQGVQTINMSLAGPRNAILDRLIRDAVARGHTIVAAAGNGGPTAPPAYPAAVPGVVAVTAVDKDLKVYRYANRGRYITVAAPGVDVVAARAPGGYARFTGTSFATPHVTAWLARCRAGGISGAACTDRLRRTARDLGTAGFDETYGFGVIE
jgi:subtilisin family serine protease